MIIKKEISEKNEDSWTIFTDKFHSNLLIEPKIENIKVYTTVQNVKFTKLFSKNFNWFIYKFCKYNFPKDLVQIIFEAKTFPPQFSAELR